MTIYSWSNLWQTNEIISVLRKKKNSGHSNLCLLSTHWLTDILLTILNLSQLIYFHENAI